MIPSGSCVLCATLRPEMMNPPSAWRTSPPIAFLWGIRVDGASDCVGMLNTPPSIMSEKMRPYFEYQRAASRSPKLLAIRLICKVPSEGVFRNQTGVPIHWSSIDPLPLNLRIA